MKYNLVINDNILLMHQNEIIEQYENYEDLLVGNIYIGKVKTVVNGMEASFIDIGENRNALLKSNKYKSNSNIIVQVKKDPVGKKGAIVTDKIQLPGKYVILLVTEKFISVSRKITNVEESTRLKNLVKENLKDYGVIIRTLAENETEKIILELQELIKLWENLKKVDYIVPSLIYKDNFIKKIIKGLTDKNILSIKTDRKEIVKNILDELNLSIPIEEDEFIKLENLNKKNIWLKCGGYIAIEETEALIVIDVNSGSYIGKENLEDTAQKINIEATIEIAKQIRLRNLRGIIIIDYINIENDENKSKIIEVMKKETQKDRTKVDVYGFTKLGLLEIVRKKIG